MAVSRINDDTGAGTQRALRRRPLRKETPVERIVVQRVAGLGASGANAHHRRGDILKHGRERQPTFVRDGRTGQSGETGDGCEHGERDFGALHCVSPSAIAALAALWLVTCKRMREPLRSSRGVLMAASRRSSTRGVRGRLGPGQKASPVKAARFVALGGNAFGRRKRRPRWLWIDLAPSTGRNHGTSRQRRLAQEAISRDGDASRVGIEQRPKMVVTRIGGGRRLAEWLSPHGVGRKFPQDGIDLRFAQTMSFHELGPQQDGPILGQQCGGKEIDQRPGEHRIQDPGHGATDGRASRSATTTFVSTTNTGAVIARARRASLPQPA